MYDKIENLFCGAVILIAETLIFIKNNAHLSLFIIVSALAALCLPRGFSGEQNSVLLGWIGLASAMAAIVMFVVWLENSGDPELIENADHKNPAPDPNLWITGD